MPGFCQPIFFSCVIRENRCYNIKRKCRRYFLHAKSYFYVQNRISRVKIMRFQKKKYVNPNPHSKVIQLWIFLVCWYKGFYIAFNFDYHLQSVSFQQVVDVRSDQYFPYFNGEQLYIDFSLVTNENNKCHFNR